MLLAVHGTLSAHSTTAQEETNVRLGVQGSCSHSKAGLRQSLQRTKEDVAEEVPAPAKKAWHTNARNW